MQVPVVERILSANDSIAGENRARLDAAGVVAINIMASPGAGKTSVILKTIAGLKDRLRLAVIEGDTAPVTIDSEQVMAQGVPAVQVNTAGSCHLDAGMIARALAALDLAALDLIILENVGNLVCPAAFQLGAHADVVIASVPEGADKPYKYPKIYRGIEALILNKMDLLPYVRFDEAYFRRGVEALNADLAYFPLSCETGSGVAAWTEWLFARCRTARV
ncbi:MAG: hydrogenase nickel incorporation protein HypB [Vicinamibacteria bacterium]|nr:hydrogenase nickel incorporation protein HypB [Vicinamibacteria bacterium]